MQNNTNTGMGMQTNASNQNSYTTQNQSMQGNIGTNVTTQQISQQLQTIQQQLRQLQSSGNNSSNIVNAANYVKDACDVLNSIQ